MSSTILNRHKLRKDFSWISQHMTKPKANPHLTEELQHVARGLELLPSGISAFRLKAYAVGKTFTVVWSSWFQGKELVKEMRCKSKVNMITAVSSVHSCESFNTFLMALQAENKYDEIEAPDTNESFARTFLKEVWKNIVLKYEPSSYHLTWRAQSQSITNHFVKWLLSIF